MTIKQRADDTTVQRSGIRLMFLLRFPLGNDLNLAVLRETADV